MAGNLITIVNELAAIKQLDRAKITEIITESLQQAISKKLAPDAPLDIIADFETNQIVAKFSRTVVEYESNMLGEMSIEEAQGEHDPAAELDDVIHVTISISDFEPKVIKTARKFIQERIKLLEEERIMFDYEKQKKQIVTGRVRKVDFNGHAVDIGYAEALLPVEEQIDEEYYKVGDLIKCYVVSIRKLKSDVKIILSRTHPEFVKKLFESEVPEVFSGDIEIKKIVREPGMRTKVCVASTDVNIDPAGSCLGPKGIRIEQIRKELHGEQIDIVVWDDSPEQFIANAIGADLVERVYLADRGKFARVIVSEKNKNLAIGKKGKNVKLAFFKRDLKIDIYTDVEFEDKISEERRITSHVTELDGMTAKIAEILKEHGYTAVQDVFEASVEELCQLEGIGEKTAIRLKESATHF